MEKEIFGKMLQGAKNLEVKNEQLEAVGQENLQAREELLREVGNIERQLDELENATGLSSVEILEAYKSVQEMGIKSALEKLTEGMKEDDKVKVKESIKRGDLGGLRKKISKRAAGLLAALFITMAPAAFAETGSETDSINGDGSNVEVEQQESIKQKLAQLLILKRPDLKGSMEDAKTNVMEGGTTQIVEDGKVVNKTIEEVKEMMREVNNEIMKMIKENPDVFKTFYQKNESYKNNIDNIISSKIKPSINEFVVYKFLQQKNEHVPDFLGLEHDLDEARGIAREKGVDLKMPETGIDLNKKVKELDKKLKELGDQYPDAIYIIDNEDLL